MAATDECLIELRKAITYHKGGNILLAEEYYRKALNFGAHPGARILLANLILATSPSSAIRRSEALTLARLAVDNIESRSSDEQWKLSARYAYFLLQFGGFIQMDGEQPDIASFGISEFEKNRLLTEAVTSLQRVTCLQPNYTVAWRNLCIALTASNRLIDAEVAASKAVDAAIANDISKIKNTTTLHTSNTLVDSSSGSVSKLWELYYKHGKALKRVGRSVDSLSRYCDACEASNGEPIVMYWLRIALANDSKGTFGIQEHISEKDDRDDRDVTTHTENSLTDCLLTNPGKIPDELRKRVIKTLQTFGNSNQGSLDGSSTSSSSSSSSTFVPHEYIRKLFDGYSKKFDNHLVNSLGYTTPEKLMTLVLQSEKEERRVRSQESSSSSSSSSNLSPHWLRCADLGCGTGLLGPCVRPFVDFLAGCDLSGGMISEAKHRLFENKKTSTTCPLYDTLAVEEIEKFLKQETSTFDLILAADVFVYIGPLDDVFLAAKKSMIRMNEEKSKSSTDDTLSSPIFAFSTESFETHFLDTTLSRPNEPFTLTSTGRCVHSRDYIRNLASINGFTELAVERTVIRKNAGKDVVGDLYVFSLSYGRFEHLFDRRLNEVRGRRVAMEERRVMEEGRTGLEPLFEIND
jgi:predicted TPR repeat methyltransferase/tetratricopeptide (TPR) repeat protein